MVAGGEHCQFRAAIEVLVPYTHPVICAPLRLRFHALTLEPIYSKQVIVSGTTFGSGPGVTGSRSGRTSRPRHCDDFNVSAGPVARVPLGEVLKTQSARRASAPSTQPHVRPRAVTVLALAAIRLVPLCLRSAPIPTSRQALALLAPVTRRLTRDPNRYFAGYRDHFLRSSRALSGVFRLLIPAWRPWPRDRVQGRSAAYGTLSRWPRSRDPRSEGHRDQFAIHGQRGGS